MAEKVTKEHIAQLVTDGFTVIPNAVAPELVQQALRAINSELGKGIKEEEAESFVNGVCFPELMLKPTITHLFTLSHAAKIARALIGDYHVVNAGQIAMRFPGWGCVDKVNFTPAPWWNRAWHIDGLLEVNKPTGNHTKGQIGNFTCLLGVVLQDIPAPFSGNLIAYPGSHRILGDHFKQHPQDLQRLEQEGEKALPTLPFPPPKQVTARAGDITICHYSLAHSVAPNASHNVRYVVYFRLFAKEHRPHTYRKEAMTNIWVDWKGLKQEDIERHSKAAGLSSTPRLDQGMANLSIQAPATPQAATDLTQYSRLATETDKLFDKEKWADAFEGYQKLAEVFEDDWNYQFRAGFCAAMGYAFGENKQKAIQGEKAIRRAIVLFPDFVGGYVVLARILACAKQYPAVLEAVTKGLSFPHFTPEFAWAGDLVVDGMRTSQEALVALGRGNEVQAWRDRILAVYPELVEKITQVLKEGDAVSLWAQGDKVLKTQPINWVEGQRIFSRLAELQPQIYWAHLQAAACYTYGPPQTVKKGEAYAKQAIEIDPLCLCGYAVLARNLQFQARPQEAISAAEAMLNCKADGQHVDLAMEGLRAVQAAYGALSNATGFEGFTTKFVQHFPFWKAQAQQVSSAGCSIM